MRAYCLCAALLGAVLLSSSMAENEIRYFPQWANGSGGKTRVIILNDCLQEASGTVLFQNNAGDLTAVPIGGALTEQVPFEIPRCGVLDIETDGTGPLESGALEIAFNLGEGDEPLAGVDAVVQFDILNHFVTVPSSVGMTAQKAPVSVNFEAGTKTEDTGIAIYNSSGNIANLSISLLPSDGDNLTPPIAELLLQPRQQLARFVTEEALFREYFDLNPGDFSGSLQILSDQPVAVTGLFQKFPSGKLVAVPASTTSFTEETYSVLVNAYDVRPLRRVAGSVTTFSLGRKVIQSDVGQAVFQMRPGTYELNVKNPTFYQPDSESDIDYFVIRKDLLGPNIEGRHAFDTSSQVTVRNNAVFHVIGIVDNFTGDASRIISDPIKPEYFWQVLDKNGEGLFRFPELEIQGFVNVIDGGNRQRGLDNFDAINRYTEHYNIVVQPEDTPLPESNYIEGFVSPKLP